MDNSNLIIANAVDIYTYPETKDTLLPNKNIQFTLGDLHSNAIKLLYFLIRQNIIDVKKNEYQSLVTIYQKETNDITNNDLVFFDACLTRAEILHPAKIQLLGDDLADRGENDYFILKIYEKLSQAQIPFEILLSNHNIEFLWSYERGLNEFISPRIGFMGQDRSLENLGILITQKILSRNDIENIKKVMEKIYLPNLKPISYTMDKQKQCITLYTHAPIGFDVIKLLAEWLDVPYADDTIENLAQTIVSINTAFTQRALTHQLTDFCKMDDTTFDFQTNPFYLITWKRGYQGLNIISTKNNYHLKYVHGHDGAGRVDFMYQDYVTNLDNMLGKGPAPKNTKDRLGKYEVLVTHF